MVKYQWIWLAILALVLNVSANADDRDQQNDQRKDSDYPLLIPVPTGFQPEGVVAGKKSMLYVGSLLSGGIYQVNLHTGEGSLLVESSAYPAVGLAYDKRSNYIFVAGGPSGMVTVYDSASGEEVGSYKVAEAVGFINDGIVTRDAAYFTDSFFPRLYKLPLGPRGALPKSGETSIIELNGDFENVDGQFNANGIESKGRNLYVVNSFSGKLFQVNPDSGYATEIDLGGDTVVNGDGIVFGEDNQLYVVQNFFNQVSVVKLSHGGSSGFVSEVITDPNYQIPTTGAIVDDYLYVINARFDVAPPPLFGTPPADPTLEYHLVGVKIDH